MATKVFVIEKPSKEVADLMNKLRDRKFSKLKEMRDKKDSFVKIKIS